MSRDMTQKAFEAALEKHGLEISYAQTVHIKKRRVTRRAVLAHLLREQRERHERYEREQARKAFGEAAVAALTTLLDTPHDALEGIATDLADAAQALREKRSEYLALGGAKATKAAREESDRRLREATRHMLTTVLGGA